MREIDLHDEESGATVFRDVILLALAGFITIVMLLLPHVNPPTAKLDSDNPGNVMIEVRWPDEMNVDIDLWVQAPGDMPVGYSNKGGQVFNLLRDDLGQDADLTELNYEFCYSRGVPSGDYAVNVHWYRGYTEQGAVPVSIVVSVKKGKNLQTQRILATRLDIQREGQELTAFRFKLNDEGDLIKESVHNLPVALRPSHPT